MRKYGSSFLISILFRHRRGHYSLSSGRIWYNGTRRWECTARQSGHAWWGTNRATRGKITPLILKWRNEFFIGAVLPMRTVWFDRHEENQDELEDWSPFRRLGCSQIYPRWNPRFWWWQRKCESSTFALLIEWIPQFRWVIRIFPEPSNAFCKSHSLLQITIMGHSTGAQIALNFAFSPGISPPGGITSSL